MTSRSRPSHRIFNLGTLTLPMIALRIHGITVSDIAYAASGLFLVLEKETWRRDLRAQVYVTLATLVGLIGILLSELRDPYALPEGVAVAARLLFVWGVWFWIARRCLITKGQLEASLTYVSVGCAISGFVALAQYRWGFEPFGSIFSTGRMTGLTQNPNDCGGTLALGFSLAIVTLLRRNKSRSSTLAWAVLLIGCLVGLVLSGSVTGMISAITGFTVAVFSRRLSAYRFIAVSVCGTLAIWLTLQVQSVGTHLGTMGDSPLQRFLAATGHFNYVQDTTASRLGTMQAGLHWVESDPFIGRGFSAEQMTTASTLVIHSLVLGFWAYGGLLALIGVTWLCLQALVSVRRAPNSLARDQLAAALGAELVFALTAPILYQRYFWLPIIFSVVLGSLPATGSRGPASRRNSIQSGFRASTTN